MINSNLQYFKCQADCTRLLAKIRRLEDVAFASGDVEVSAEFKMFRAAVYKLKALSKN